MKPATIWLLALLSLPALAPSARQGAAIRSLHVEQPRPFGYTIGDRIDHDIELVLNSPFRLDPDSLPQPGRINRWLRLASPRLHSEALPGATRYRLRLSYQLVNLEPRVREMQTPEIRLAFGDGQGRFVSPVTAWRFRAAAVSDPGRRDLRPDRAPPLQPRWSPWWFRLLAAGLFAALAAYAYRRLLAPWRAASREPFQRAERALARLALEPDTPARYRQALATVHRAFSQTAGRAVFADGLGELFAEQPQLARLRQPIERFFRHSRQVLFADAEPHPESPRPARAKPGGPDSGPHYTLAALAGLCRDCYRRRRERV